MARKGHFKYNTEEARKLLIDKHGEEKYDYSEVEYVNAITPIKVTCRKHGAFYPLFAAHLTSTGCPRCGIEKMADGYRASRDEFVAKGVARWGDMIDYSKVDYVNARTKVTLICKEHGEFEQVPDVHVRKSAVSPCPKCSMRISGEKKTKKALSTYREEYLKRLKKKFGDRFTVYIPENPQKDSELNAICPTHGSFITCLHSIDHSKHLCPECATASRMLVQKHTDEDFIRKAQLVHKGKYTYGYIKYQRGSDPVEITCPQHGNFFQRASRHLEGKGCPECNNSGFSSMKSGYFYILQDGDLTKIGISNLSGTKRARDINRNYGKSFQVVASYFFEKGVDCRNVESEMLRRLKKLYDSPDNTFVGYSETFLNVDIKRLKEETEEVISEFT